MSDPTAAAASAPETRKRTAAEIRADIERTRQEVKETVEQLAFQADPREQIKVKVAETKASANTFVDDVRSGEPKALAVAGGVVAAVAAVIAISLRKK